MANIFLALPSMPCCQATNPSPLSIHSPLTHSHFLFLSDDDDVSDTAKSGWRGGSSEVGEEIPSDVFSCGADPRVHGSLSVLSSLKLALAALADLQTNS